MLPGFELLFVNSLGLPFNSGLIFYIVLILALLVYGIYYSLKKQKVILNTALLGILMLLLGYSSFAVVVIRSNAETPINENQPDNVFSLLSYLDREQYGDRPLIWGQYYNTPVKDVVENKNNYAPLDKKYEVVGHNYKVNYDNRYCTLFPRMYSTDPSHIEVYKEWGHIKGNLAKVEDRGKTKNVYIPTFGENIRFFLKYQIGYMYMRYFLWNFVGRQNDEQGNGGILKGNWISGIGFIDSKLVGTQKGLPPVMKNIPSRNVYYGLPFLLGILGLFYIFDKNRRSFLITTLFFIMTGIAIVIYLNQTPLQPRERDYAYAGSFYVFAIWIGFGVIALYEFLKNQKFAFLRAIVISGVCLLLVPGIMAKENWDDHDRSGRYTTRSYAFNYLNSCAPNAILFTFGDNDTFPLWYLQEVEGIRTDVRVVNLMLFSADWYFDQMKKKAYNSEPLPISLVKKQYIGEKRDRIYIVEKIKDYINLKQAVDFVASDSPDTKKIGEYDQIDYLPGRNFIIPVDKQAVLKNGTVSLKDSDKIEKEIRFTVKGSDIDKSQLGTLDIIANNNLSRPIYFDACNIEGTLNLNEYLQLEGFAYRLVPIKTKYSSMLDCGKINTDVMYNNMMNKFDYGRMNALGVYLDQFHLRTLSVLKFKNNFTRLAKALLAENKKDSAIAVLNKCQELTPLDKVPDDIFSIAISETYFAAGDTANGLKIMKRYSQTCSEKLGYFLSLPKVFRENVDFDISYSLESLRQMLDVAEKYNQPFKNELKNMLKKYNSISDNS